MTLTDHTEANSTSTFNIEVINSTLECPPDVESWVPFYTILFPVFLTGLVGNGVVIFAFVRHKNVRSAPNTLLFSLAVADFITLVLCATAPAYDFVGDILPALCPVIRVIMETAMHGTGFSLLFLSMERYFAIVHPLRTKAASAAFIRRAVTFTWAGGSILSLVKFFLQTPPSQCQKCVRMIDPRNLTAVYAVINFLINYVIPLTVISICYILMARKLYFSGRSVQQQNKTFIRQMEVRKRVAFRVLLLVIIYAVSFFPYNFFSLKVYLLEDLTIAQDIGPLITILYCIGCVHISLNPLILYFLSNAFRTYFNNYLFRCIFKHTDPIDESNSNHQRKDSDKRVNIYSPM